MQATPSLDNAPIIYQSSSNYLCLPGTVLATVPSTSLERGHMKRAMCTGNVSCNVHSVPTSHPAARFAAHAGAHRTVLYLASFIRAPLTTCLLRVHFFHHLPWPCLAASLFDAPVQRFAKPQLLIDLIAECKALHLSNLASLASVADCKGDELRKVSARTQVKDTWCE